MHKDNVEASGAVEAECVEGGFEARDVSVVVGTPNVDDPVKAAHRELVAVVGDVGGEVGIEAVGAAEYVVFEVEFFDFRRLFPGLYKVVPHDFGGFQPQRAVALIRPAAPREFVDSLGDVAALVQRGFQEPGVVGNLVA